MAATLKQIKNGLRLKLGELQDGTWGTVPYGDSGEVFDELRFAINRAQEDVARDIYDPETYPLTRTGMDKPVITGATYYTLPADFLFMEKVSHFKTSRARPVLKGSIKNIKSATETVSGGYYRYYEVRGQTGSYVADGTATQASDNQLIDSGGDFTSARIGDIIYNLTDDSEAVITNFVSGSVVFDELQGGMRNEFDIGDQYAIATQEQTRKMMFVDPPVTNSNIVLYNGSPAAFTVSQSGIVQEVYVTHSTLPEGWTDENVAEYKIVTDDNGALASNDPRSIAGANKIRVGINQIPFTPFQMEYGVTYHIHSTFDISQVTPTAHSNVLSISNVRLELTSSDRLILSYARRPRPLVRDESICELPNEFLSALYQGAANILIEKVSDNNMVPQVLLQRYEYEINKAKAFLDAGDESGPYEIGVDADGQPVDYLYQSQSDKHRWIRW